MAAIFGFLTGLFLALTLLAFGVIPVESILVTVLPFIGLIMAFVLAMWAPIGAGGQSQAPPQAQAPPPAGADQGSV